MPQPLSFSSSRRCELYAGIHRAKLSGADFNERGRDLPEDWKNLAEHVTTTLTALSVSALAQTNAFMGGISNSRCESRRSANKKCGGRQAVHRIDFQTESNQALFNSSAVIGILRMRLPVALNTAFATLGPMVAVTGSPMPPGCSVEATRWTATTGISLMRSTG